MRDAEDSHPNLKYSVTFQPGLFEGISDVARQ